MKALFVCSGIVAIAIFVLINSLIDKYGNWKIVKLDRMKRFRVSDQLRFRKGIKEGNI